MKKNIKEILPYIIVLVAVILVKKFVFSPIQVSGDSMYSTLHDNDIMFLNKIGYRINGLKRFDIVVIRHEDKYLIKRVIGLPNEEIEVKDNKLYINGKYTEQPFLAATVFTGDFHETIPDDCYFVMGDNREISLDSRMLGCFNKDKIEGKTNLTIFPFSRFGTKK